MESPLKLLGLTEDGRKVIGGLFELADTHGIPLSISLEQLNRHQAIASWADYFMAAMSAGWTDEQAFKHIREALQDVGMAKDFEPIKMRCIALYMKEWKS